ncbi:retrovirus-related pol polyprotein from transposon TNT 1-94 [Tanacetum coccineum]|uniref:Retrovirus-related pol polyprotein from transposon TNT 1-94 n=1 Tax=Tanacetum coccineum TaxID=301880 RepID=A0ABQ5B2B5_9ASTR
MEEFATNDNAIIYSGIASIMVNGKRAYELKGKFLDDLRDKDFSGTNGEDAVEHIEYFLKIVDPINLPNVNYERLRLSVFLISLVGNASEWFDEFKEGVADKEFSKAEKANNDDEQETAEIFIIETNLFDYETLLCTKFKEFNFLLKVDPELFTHDIERTKTYEDYKNKLNDELEEPWSEDGVPYEICDHICEHFHFKNRKAKWPTCNSNEDGFCNGGELPGMVRVGYMTYFQDYKWYNKLADGNLKEEALKQKAFYEKLWGDAAKIVEIVLWYLDSRSILGYGDLQMRNILISRVYYVEGLGHNLFSVGQFCDSDLDVAFRKHTCFVRNLEGVDLLSGSRGSNLYTISMADMMKSSPICLLSKASKTKSWLWHRCLSHLNFDTINTLAKQGLVKGLPNLKYTKDHLCSVCQMGKSKKESHPHKPEPSTNEKLQMVHMDLCGPMRVESINKKRYILVIVDDYSRFTWVKFLRSKDEAPKIIITILKQAQVSLNAIVRYLRTDNDTEFLNQTLRNYTEDVGITHMASTTRTPQQNGVVERHNRTLVDATRTMLIFSKSTISMG